MAEFSLPWGGIITGDCGPYNDDTWTDMERKLFSVVREWRGVVKRYANELAVTGVASPISVATGAALVDGKYYENTAILAVVIPVPAVATRYDWIVLRKSWAAQTVRVTRVAGVEGAGAPAISQVDGATWDIPLALVMSTILGVITVTDTRRYHLLAAAHELLIPEDGWVDRRDIDVWTFVGANSFTVVGDRTAIYRKGSKLRWKEGGAFKYGYVVSSVYGAPNTTVTFTGGSDYALLGGAITDGSVSYVLNPDGFPEWFNWAPTIVGYGVLPANPEYRFCIHGRTVTINMCEAAPGTSNAVTLTYSLPVTALVGANGVWNEEPAISSNNGAGITTAVGSILTGSPTLLSCFTSEAGGAWTNVNGKSFANRGFQLSYQMA